MARSFYICTKYVIVYILLFVQCEVFGECDEKITTSLKSHIFPNAIKLYRGNFTDVWASRHVTDIIKGSYTEIWEDGFITNYVINKVGQSSSASGKIWSDDEGIIHIKVDGFDVAGLIFPIYASPNVIGYYTCYPGVEGAGVSVVAARRGCLFLPNVIEHVLEAKVKFRSLQELGIPINDGMDYEHGR